MLILCLHKVGPQGAEGRFLNMEPERLRRNIRFLKRRGLAFVQAKDLRGILPERSVCLTFDDCYTSTMTHGVSVLRQEGVTASFYAVAGLVGKASEWDADRARPLADWAELRQAASEGFEIGSHTYSHAHLGELSLEDQIAEIRKGDLKMKEEGLPPTSFCLPYGSQNEHTPSAIKNCGHLVGLALGKRLATGADDRLLLPRVILAYSDGSAGLMYKAWVRPKLRRPRT